MNDKDTWIRIINSFLNKMSVRDLRKMYALSLGIMDRVKIESQKQ